MTVRTYLTGSRAATALLVARLCVAVSVGALFLTGTCTVAAASPATTCSPSWTTASTPGTPGFLYSVAAVSASNVWAVGLNYSNSTPLIEHWNGSAWHVVKSPSLDGNLRSLFKVSATNIWAVGSTPKGTLIENWNGVNWSVAPSPSPGNYANALFSVSGTSSSDIWAVGDQISQQGSTYTGSELIEHWNGSAWSVSATPLGDFQLLSVEALSPSDAWAAGYSGEPGNQEVLAHWNGSQWTSESGPPGNNYIVNGMSKSSSTALGWAAGEYALGGKANAQMFRWNTASDAWRAVHTPLPSGNSALSLVVQVSSSDAWAVGDTASGLSLIEHWDGWQWAIDPDGTMQGDLSGVAVSSGNAKVAWAVGGRGSATAPPLVLTRCA
jgi:hypothetical protein